MIIRQLRPNDISNTVILMNYYRDDAGIADEDWDVGKIVQNLKQYAIGGDHACLLAMEGDRVVGGIFGSIRQEFYNSKTAAIIHFIFLIPTHRTEDNYFQLYDQFKLWSDRFEVEKILLTDLMDNNTNLVEVGNVLGFEMEKINLFVKDVA